VDQTPDKWNDELKATPVRIALALLRTARAAHRHRPRNESDRIVNRIAVVEHDVYS